MKLLLVLLCLLLCGCSQEAPETEMEFPAATAAAVEETKPTPMYDPENPLEAQYQGALKVYPLTMRKVQGIRTLGEDVLVFSGYGSTTLTVLTGEELYITAQVTLDLELSPEDPSVRIGDGTVSYFDPVSRMTIVLNEDLKEVSRIAITEAITGSPILSADRNILYYCTSNAILAWDLETGIHRTVTELVYDEQSLTGLHWNDTVLQCRIRDGENIQTLFLSAETGRILSQQDGDVALMTDGERYYAALPVSSMEMLVFGDTAGTPKILYPEDLAAENFYLPKSHAVITASILADERILLNYYALSSGTRRAELSLEPLQTPRSIADAEDGSVYILVYDPEADCDTLYRWDASHAVFSSDPAESAGYTGEYSAVNSADPEALAQCQAYADQLSEKYSIRIHIYEDALDVQPWDYEFEAESLPRVILQELGLLDQRLSQYPEDVLEKTASHFTSLNISLVRQITGTAASGSLNTATGIQFLEGMDAYVVITVGKYSQQALYHELYHVMETHILNESTALDLWESRNPEGFEYTYGYAVPESAQSYLEGENRAFVDIYSMSYPKEDRARILENAMLPGNRELFRSETMQAKLTAICEGIRQAYGLRRSEDTFLWEQYLDQPLAYTK